jgi:hypothetical protein
MSGTRARALPARGRRPQGPVCRPAAATAMRWVASARRSRGSGGPRGSSATLRPHLLGGRLLGSLLGGLAQLEASLDLGRGQGAKLNPVGARTDRSVVTGLLLPPRPSAGPLAPRRPRTERWLAPVGGGLAGQGVYRPHGTAKPTRPLPPGPTFLSSPLTTSFLMAAVTWRS